MATQTTKSKGRPKGSSNKKPSTSAKKTSTGTLPKPQETTESTTPAAATPAPASKPAATPTAKKPAATTTKKPTPTAAAPKDPLAATLKEFDKAKSKVDVFIQASYQGFNLMLGPSVKTDFSEAIAAASERIGLTYSKYARTIYLSGVTPNYDTAAILNAIQSACDYYKYKFGMADVSMSPTDPEELAKRLQAIVYSVLPPQAA